MDILFQRFSEYLYSEDKEAAVNLIVDKFKLVDKIEDLVFIYTEVLEKALNTMMCASENKVLCIWKEHVRSAIVRTILENAYPHIVRLRKSLYKNAPTKKVTVVCPDGEYHEIGARMVADFFALANFDTVFVGSSTPKEEFILAINEIKPDVLALSVTNYFNIVSAQKTIAAIRNSAKECPLIVVGGNAFINNPDITSIGADRLLNSFDEICKLSEEVNNAATN